MVSNNKKTPYLVFFLSNFPFRIDSYSNMYQGFLNVYYVVLCLCILHVCVSYVFPYIVLVKV